MAARVLLDARKIGDGGIGVYLDTLITGAYELVRAGRIHVELVLLVPRIADIAQNRLNLATFERWGTMWESREEAAGKYSASEYLLLARRHRACFGEIDVFHSPHYTLPYFLELPSVVTVHDVIHLNPPTSGPKRRIARRLVGSALARADQVITVSRHSKLMIEQQFPKVSGAITVVHNAVFPAFVRQPAVEMLRFCEQNDLQKPYCLFVGSDKAHKGFDILLDAWPRVTAAPGFAGLQLLVVGDQFAARTRERIRELGLDHTIRFVGAVPAEALCRLYNGARATLVTSLAEGFGLCALEALACGSAVVSTPLPSIREICAESADYSVDFSGEGFARAVVEVIERVTSCEIEQSVELRVARALRFTAARMVLETCSVYDAAISLTGGPGSTREPAADGPNVWRADRFDRRLGRL